MATQFDIGTVANPVYAGTTISITFTLQPTQTTTGWNTQVTFKKLRSDSTAILVLLPALVSTGIWTVVLTAAQTALFSVPGTYQYDFERIDVGFEAVLTTGAFQIDRKVK